MLRDDGNGCGSVDIAFTSLVFWILGYCEFCWTSYGSESAVCVCVVETFKYFPHYQVIPC